ncbi:hypothetical protein TCAL_16888 [Tigriopus californicus]|uniref:Uncharacterized protein n=1 Tax=Tigriopus californicus TaxID=6832 RepID=A0A553P6G6_TIGCA|nr:hypothetical protein TCAL_16888 [Tigriopus californicus]
MEMLMRTGMRSVGLALSTWSSDWISGVMNHTNSVMSINTMKDTQHTDTIAPVVVGCVRSLGIFRGILTL